MSDENVQGAVQDTQAPATQPDVSVQGQQQQQPVEDKVPEKNRYHETLRKLNDQDKTIKELKNQIEQMANAFKGQGQQQQRDFNQDWAEAERMIKSDNVDEFRAGMKLRQDLLAFVNKQEIMKEFENRLSSQALSEKFLTDKAVQEEYENIIADFPDATPAQRRKIAEIAKRNVEKTREKEDESFRRGGAFSLTGGGAGNAANNYGITDQDILDRATQFERNGIISKEKYLKRAAEEMKNIRMPGWRN